MPVNLKNIQAENNLEVFPGDTEKPGKTKSSALLNREISLFGTKFGAKQKARLFSELGILLESGLDLARALKVAIAELKTKKEKHVVESIRKSLLSGISFSEALLKTGKFRYFEYFSLKIGEETGKTGAILFELANYYQRKISQQRKIINASVYPVIVLITAFVAILFMTNVMIPMFSSVFKRFRGDLPPLTKTIIDISVFVQDNLGIFFFLLTIVTILIFILRKKTWFRKITGQIALKLPFAGKLILLTQLEKFTNAMTLLLGSNVHLLKAIQLTRQMTGFYLFETALHQAEKKLLKGKHLYEAIQQYNFFDERFVSLVNIGEEAGRLDNAFDRLRQQYTEELEHKFHIMGTLLEPVLIIFVGAIVAIILVAMYLPMFKISTYVY
jgi:type IV pilus assembly protein PilC